jgi:hypothetical protein
MRLLDSFSRLPASASQCTKVKKADKTQHALAECWIPATLASGYRYGVVESVRLRSVPVDLESMMPRALQIKAGKVATERTTANAFVQFASADAVPAALASNMALFEGTHLRVDRAAAPSRGSGTVRFEPRRSVFLGNLAFDVEVRPPCSHLSVLRSLQPCIWRTSRRRLWRCSPATRRSLRGHTCGLTGCSAQPRGRRCPL